VIYDPICNAVATVCLVNKIKPQRDSKTGKNTGMQEGNHLILASKNAKAFRLSRSQPSHQGRNAGKFH